MNIPVERKVPVYLGMILIIQLILLSFLTLGSGRIISTLIATAALVAVSVFLLLTAIIFRRKINEQSEVEKKLRESEQELLLALRSSKESQAGLFAKEIEARAQAEAANRTKDELIAIVSHELRSPLNAMLGWARVLRSKG